MNYLTIPGELLQNDSDYGPGTNGYVFPDTFGTGIRFDPGDDGALTGSFAPPDGWDGTIRASAAVYAPAQQAETHAEFFVQARVCNVGEDVRRPEANDVRHTMLLTIPAEGAVQQPVLRWGPINPFTPDGNAFAPGALVTFRIGYNATSPNTDNTGAVIVRAVNFDL